jgi:formate hydrogenlyase subunit 3/multisubunit Na+/H+ antiporter MnhD subunit
MLELTFALPLIAALLCLALSYRVPARQLGIGAAASLLVCGAALLAARLLGRLPLVLIDRIWLTLDQRAVSLALAFDAANWGFALLALAGGGLGLLALALAVPPNVRGFGGLFAAALLALAAVVGGLANRDPVLLPFLWALAALLIFVALRASGALAGSDAPIVVLMAGLGGALLALGAVLAMPIAALGAPLPLALIGWTLAGMLALGAVPFHATTHSLAEAPAALAGALLGPGIPLLGGYALIRFVAGQEAALPRSWGIALALLGLLALLACAAGALGTRRLRQLVGWQFGAQVGLVLLALGQAGTAPGDRAIAPPAVAAALLTNAVLSTIVCYLAVAVLERRAGTDDMAEIELRDPLRLPGLALLAGAASAAGLPGTWGLWTRRWLFDELALAAPWAIPIVLAAGVLLALAWVAPLALFWGRAFSDAADHAIAPGGRLSAGFAGLAAAAPLLILGVMPALAWNGWLADFQAGPAQAVAAPALPGALGQAVCLVAALLLIALPLIARTRRYASPDALPRQPGAAAPSALGDSLRGLAWLATAAEAFAGAWGALLALSRGLRRGMALFEQRYYLAGLLIAVILMVMLFIQ